MAKKITITPRTMQGGYKADLSGEWPPWEVALALHNTLGAVLQKIHANSREKASGKIAVVKNMPGRGNGKTT